MSEIHAIVKDKIYPRQKQVAIVPYADAAEKQASRFYREVGFGIKTPETAIHATYVDKKCPFTGDVIVRGRIFKGEVFKMKADKTIVVLIRYLFYDRKYKRYARRNTKINCHCSPCFQGIVKLGDTVVCGETRPLSKTKSSVVLAVEKKAETGRVKVFENN